MVSALSNSSNIPFFGYGIGMGTNVGSMLISGKVEFLISESEWGRMIGELGAILGISAVLIRVALAFNLIKRSFRKMVSGDVLAWMLLSFALLLVAQASGRNQRFGIWCIVGWVVMAALNTKQEISG